MKKFLLIILVICSNAIHKGQNIHEVKDLLSGQLLHLCRHENNTVIDKPITIEIFSKSLHNDNISKMDKERLIKSYGSLLNMKEEGVKPDSLIKTFYGFYLDFSQTCISMFSLSNDQYSDKIIFFGTSVSCPCTIDLCVEQLANVIKVSKEIGATYIIVDSFLDSEYTDEYEIGFYPTVIVLDNRNLESARFTRDKNLLSSLADHFKNN